MGKDFITFSDTEVEKHKFYQHKNSISICDVDVNKTVVSSKFPFGRKCFKYFIGYKDVRKVRTLCIRLPKMSAYTRKFDETKYMSFLKTMMNC